jgi:MFS family permease
MSAPRTEPSPVTSASPSRKAWLRVASAVAVAAWGGNHFTPLLLLYTRSEGYTSVEVNLLLAFYVVGLIPGFLLSGPFSDRHGRKSLMLASLLIGAFGAVLLALGAESIVMLCGGRLLSGLSVAIAMVVGSSWIKELSSPIEGTGKAGSGARRASLSLTIGFGAGAGVSGTLAQWGPWPTVLPYVVYIAASVPALVALVGAPESRSHDPRVTSFLADLRIPRAARKRFAGVVLPIAPWVFGAAAIAYAVMPELMQHQVGSFTIAFATLLTVVTLGFGAAAQSLELQIVRWTNGRPGVAGLGLITIGAALASFDAVALSPAVAVATGAVLGMGYGICLVAGLAEVQAMAGPDDIAGITGIYYSLTYIGFALPALLAAIAMTVPYVALLACVGGLCLLCGALVVRNTRRAEWR